MKDVWSQVKIKQRKAQEPTGPSVSASNHAQLDPSTNPPASPQTALRAEQQSGSGHALEGHNRFRWRCPVCREPLESEERSWRCTNRHSFDQARDGYINLLLAHKKHSAEPGDSKSMLAGRRHFLERGFYAPLADKLAALITGIFPEQNDLCILDAGCGEGYYLGQLAERLSGKHHFTGIDISRAAMRMAGKRYPDMQFAVASSHDLPLDDQSVDVLLRVFAPAAETEVARVLKPGGLYLWVYPGEQHLFALRELIYDRPQPHAPANTQAIESVLHQQAIESVHYPLSLPDAAAVQGLLEMTPYYWTASPEKQQACAVLPGLDLEADFRVAVWRK